ncbi:MAG TPA: DUF3782 domain-containing protein [Anaerolineae bacterium]|nr:DUF3782 domain-containing protein [Anaerolineae bacterium]HQK12356.1 DUF3782 domain-containing protein [Anaerolineae bacterium]
MENQQLSQLIRRELPGILRRDREMREWVLSLTRERYADKGETESRFDRLLEELRRDREENTRKWEEQNRRWEEQNRKWEEQNRRWEEQNRKWEEQNRKWDENQATINAMLAEIHALSRKHDSTIGALGARWGLQTEQSFRNALAGILGSSFGVEVLNVTEYDDAGEVFGRPDQVELDVIIQNGLLLLCEIKSSMSKSDMVIFERKVRFYEKRHNRKADRILVISPMVDASARALANELGIEVYSYAEDVTL